MFSYSSYVLTAVASLLVTCHALCICPETSGLPGIPGLLQRDDLKGQKHLSGLPVSQNKEPNNVLSNLKLQLSRLQRVLALTGKIREVGSKIFASNGKAVDFASALQSCEKAGGTLATPANEEENKAIAGFVRQYKQYAYLGFKQCESSGQFKHLNGKPLNYTKWYRYEPNGKGKEKCVEMYTDGSWNDKRCNLSRLIICEF